MPNFICKIKEPSTKKWRSHSLICFLKVVNLKCFVFLILDWLFFMHLCLCKFYFGLWLKLCSKFEIMNIIVTMLYLIIFYCSIYIGLFVNYILSLNTIKLRNNWILGICYYKHLWDLFFVPLVSLVWAYFMITKW